MAVIGVRAREGMASLNDGAPQPLSQTKSSQFIAAVDKMPALKKIDRSATLAFCPHAPPGLIAVGSVAGAIDMSFSTSSVLEVRLLMRAGAVPEPKRLPLPGVRARLRLARGLSPISRINSSTREIQPYVMGTKSRRLAPSKKPPDLISCMELICRPWNLHCSLAS